MRTKQGGRGIVVGVLSRLQPAQPPVQWLPVTGVLLKRPGHKVNLLSPSNAEVKNEWSYTSTPLLCLHGNFNFFFSDSIYVLESSFVLDLKVKVKVECFLEQATKGQRGSRCIALLFLKPRR